MINFFQNLLKNEQISLDPLNFIGGLITAFISLYIFKADTPFSYLQERHEKLIFPLFNLLEPSLYQEINDPLLWNKIFDLIEQNKSLADGKLLHIYYYCKKNPSVQNFISLCSYADHSYDKSCRSLKLKRRTIEYRIDRHQYKSKSFFIFYLIASTLIFTFFLFFGILMLGIAFFFAKEIFNSADELGKIFLLLFYSIAALIFFKFFEKHP